MSHVCGGAGVGIGVGRGRIIALERRSKRAFSRGVPACSSRPAGSSTRSRAEDSPPRRPAARPARACAQGVRLGIQTRDGSALRSDTVAAAGKPSDLSSAGRRPVVTPPVPRPGLSESLTAPPTGPPGPRAGVRPCLGPASSVGAGRAASLVTCRVSRDVSACTCRLAVSVKSAASGSARVRLAQQ